MLGRISAIRSLGGKTLFGLVAASTLLLAACGTSSTTGATGGGTLTACSVTADQLSTGAGGTGTAPKVSGATGSLHADGSSALQPLVKAAAAEFDTANGTHMTVDAGGSGKGLTDVQGKTVDIGDSDIFGIDKDPTKFNDLSDHQVAVVVFTLVVSTDLAGKVDNLTKAQIQQIYFGQVTNWSQLGGPSELISVINRPTTSGTRATFKKYVLDNQDEKTGTLTQDNTGAVAQAIQSTPGSIGYLASGFVTGQYKSAVHPICIEGAKPTLTDINAGNYKFWNIEHMYTNGPATGLAKTLIQYVLSDQVQKNDLISLAFLPIGQVQAAQITTHTPSGAPAPETLPALGS